MKNSIYFNNSDDSDEDEHDEEETSEDNTSEPNLAARRVGPPTIRISCYRKTCKIFCSPVRWTLTTHPQTTKKKKMVEGIVTSSSTSWSSGR
jgi:hypothetical protein